MIILILAALGSVIDNTLMSTPDKFSTPNSKSTRYYTSPSTADSRSPQNYSIMKLISPGQIQAFDRRGSLALSRTSSSKGEEAVIEDRFIPSRRLIQDFDMNENQPLEENDYQRDPQSMSVAEIYSEEILGKKHISPQRTQNSENQIDHFKNKNLLRFRVDPTSFTGKPGLFSAPINELSNSYTRGRRVNKNPCKVLDAPALTDDFYLNLIDWSNENQLAVGLGNCIYLWNAVTSKVTRLCELPNDMITSVCWSNNGPNLSIGCNKGDVLVWDVNYEKQIRRLEGHEIRVGSMSWSKSLLATGSRDKTILQRDIRSPRHFVMKLTDHAQEICGLKWSGDEQYLASGGNDNKVIVWNQAGQPINKFSDHKAAVKAIAWSPHQHGLLATGGGTADRMIKMRNIFDGEIVCSEDTGSQVCNLQFSKSLHEVVSTHGYSQNQINVWQYPSMKKVASLKGHTHRVLYLATSPDGSTIVTGAGDQTLRFWTIFPSIYDKETFNQSQLDAGISFR